MSQNFRQKSIKISALILVFLLLIGFIKIPIKADDIQQSSFKREGVSIVSVPKGTTSLSNDEWDLSNRAGILGYL